MKLSTRAEYGIRALIELALQYEQASNQPLMLQIIASRQNISKKYLEQLFIPLRKAGVVEGVRGPSGGYRLSRHPDQIHLDEVFEILEGSLSIADCLDSPDLCKLSGGCATQEVWRQITRAIQDTLHGISLASLIARHSCLIDQLQSLTPLQVQPLDCSKTA